MMKSLGTDKFKRWMNSEWPWLIPAMVACLVCYFRFPELHNDDHPMIIKGIAETGSWPTVKQFRSAQHMPYAHTVAAGIYRLLESTHSFFNIPPRRAGQLLNLVSMFGIMALLVPILRRLVADYRARVLTLLVFGSSTRWMTMAVTIDNDTMMALFATLALLLTIRMMARREIPSWPGILLTAFIIALGGAVKHNGQQFIIPFIGCLISRRWFYRERLKSLVARSAVSLLIVLVITAPFYLRHHRDTGQYIYHDQGFHKKNWSGNRWEFFTFRFGDILRRPFVPYTDFTDEVLGPADLSWFSKLYMNWWSLPDFLPDRPEAAATRAIFITALPISIVFLTGFLLAFCKIKRNPRLLPALSWVFVIALFVLLASCFFPEPRWACHTYPRMWLGGAGGMMAAFGLACSELSRRWPATRWIIFLLVGLQLIAFWWLLLGGPFYSFHHPWPRYNM